MSNSCSTMLLVNSAERGDPRLSRRDFLKLFGISFTAAEVLALETKMKKLLPSFVYSYETNNLKPFYSVSNLPYILAGTGYDAPYLYMRSEDQVEEYYNYMNYSGITRMLPDKPERPLEPVLGEFDESVFKAMGRVMDRAPKGHRFILPIIDGFFILHSNKTNFMYPTSELCSPYLRDRSNKDAIKLSQLQFFTHKDMLTAYKRRADKFLEHFGNRDNVVFELGNELMPPLKGSQAVALNTYWHSEMFDHIRSVYEGPILTGVADPGYLDYSKFTSTEGLVTTDHVYFRKNTYYPENIPVIIEEIGVPQKILNVFNIKNSDQYLRNLIVNTFNDGIVEGRSSVGSVLLWQGDLDHNDNFGMRPENYRQTMEVINELSAYISTSYGSNMNGE